MNTPTRFALGAAAGAAAATLLPRGIDTRTPAAPLRLDPSHRAAVVTGAALPPWVIAALGAGAGIATRRALHTRAVRDVVGASLAATVTVALRRVCVVVGARGVTLTCGIPGVTHTVPYSAIRSARACTVTASEFGGLGLRLSADRGAGIVLRPGPALTLELTRGPLTVTVDDPEAAAALVARELDRTAGGTR